MLNDKIALITGGNSGIGLAAAKKFSEHSAKVAITGRNAKRLHSTLESMSGNHLAIQADMKNLKDIEKMFIETREKLGKIDILIANAGVAGKRHISDVDETFFDEIIDINYKGLYFTVQKSLPFLNDNASIVLVSSCAAHIAIDSNSVYASTKAAVSMLAKSLSADLVSRGIRVNAVSPGYTDTPILDKAKDLDPKFTEKRFKDVPMGRFASSEEVADAILFLASSKSSYITGADLVIDGGLSSTLVLSK